MHGTFFFSDFQVFHDYQGLWEPWINIVCESYSAETNAFKTEKNMICLENLGQEGIPDPHVYHIYPRFKQSHKQTV